MHTIGFGDRPAPEILRLLAAAGIGRAAVESTMSLRADISFLHRVPDAVDLAERCGVAVIADLYNAWTERGLERTLKSSLPRLAHVQVADFVLRHAEHPDRAVPGDGDIPVGDQLRWLREAGYDGIIELELLGHRIDAEGALAACRRGAEVIEALL